MGRYPQRCTARWLVRSAFVKQQGYASCTSTHTFNTARSNQVSMTLIRGVFLFFCVFFHTHLCFLFDRLWEEGRRVFGAFQLFYMEGHAHFMYRRRWFEKRTVIIVPLFSSTTAMNHVKAHADQITHKKFSLSFYTSHFYGYCYIVVGRRPMNMIYAGPFSCFFFSFLICSARQKKFYLLVLLIGFAAQHKHVRRSSWRIIWLGTCRWSLLFRWKGRNNRRGYQLRNDSVRDA